jgi:purine catabolism regulator
MAGAAGPVTAFSDVAGAVAEAAFVVDVAMATGRSAAGRVWRSADLGVQGLLWQLRTDPRLLSYVDAQLAPCCASMTGFADRCWRPCPPTSRSAAG